MCLFIGTEILIAANVPVVTKSMPVVVVDRMQHFVVTKMMASFSEMLQAEFVRRNALRKSVKM